MDDNKLNSHGGSREKFQQPKVLVLDVKHTQTGTFDVNETAMIVGPTTS